MNSTVEPITKDITDTFFQGTVKNFFEEKKNDFVSIFKDKNSAYDIFLKNLVMLKGIFILVFIIASIYYSLKFKDNNLMDGKTENNKKIVLESLVVGASVFVPYTMLYFLRNKSQHGEPAYPFASEFWKHSVYVVLFIVGIHLLFEYSGFYSLAYEKDPENVQEKPKEGPFKSSDKFLDALGFSAISLFFIIMIVGLIIMFIALLFIRDTNTNYNHKLFGSSILTFVVETLVVAVAGACPVYIVAYNRGEIPDDKTSIEFAVLALKFAGVHIGLQLGGFYSHIFNHKFRFE
jgi:hypothetical protein